MKKAIDKNVGSENKGIKAHFRLDESGIFHLDRVSQHCVPQNVVSIVLIPYLQTVPLFNMEYFAPILTTTTKRLGRGVIESAFTRGRQS